MAGREARGNARPSGVGYGVDATSYFDIPTNRVVEVGTQVGI